MLPSFDSVLGIILKQSFLEYLASNESTSPEIDSHLSDFGQKEQ